MSRPYAITAVRLISLVSSGLWSRQMATLQTACPGALHAKGVTYGLCSASCWLSSLSGLSLSHSPPPPSHVLQTSTGHEYPKFVKIVEVGPRDGLQNEMVGSHASHPCASWLWKKSHLFRGFFLHKSMQSIRRLSAVIDRDICFTFPLKLNRRDDTAFGLTLLHCPSLLD